MLSASRSSERGYTIIELILVIVILGTLGVVAGPRFFGNAVYDERAFMDEAAGLIRYGQKVAVASGCAVQVSFTSSRIELTQQAAVAAHCNAASGSFSTDVLLPSGDVAFGNVPSGVSVSPDTVFRFDALGRTNLAANQTFTISSRSITVEAGSGLVSTQ